MSFSNISRNLPKFSFTYNISQSTVKSSATRSVMHFFIFSSNPDFLNPIQRLTKFKCKVRVTKGEKKTFANSLNAARNHSNLVALLFRAQCVIHNPRKMFFIHFQVEFYFNPESDHQFYRNSHEPMAPSYNFKYFLIRLRPSADKVL